MDKARWLVVIVALANYGGVVADAIVPGTARQHLWNPAWPPHAKFHNGQTMVMGLFGGTLSLILLFGCGPLTRLHLFLACAAAGSYFFAMVFAPLFPGTAWTDPEFAAITPAPLGLAPQQLITYVLCVLIVIAVALGSVH
ncbi:DUF6640 family protein [Acidipila sp. EB88]|uniref:DUF6640 family protein n=1 Tax=Acidipila sp. EB88 TaxID=2305226 RepID=UPI000F5F186D|nr:DUF6640 family protein [Acidipila sp. EB88]RRA49459.1 hypothetical protein D1Y84_15410 [Acidipila sp. EB88]